MSIGFWEWSRVDLILEKRREESQPYIHLCHAISLYLSYTV